MPPTSMDTHTQDLEKQLVRRGPIDSQTMLVFSRVIVPLFTAIIMSIISWIGSHMSDAVDRHSAQLSQVTRTTEKIDDYITQREKYLDGQMEGLKNVLADHEVRLRALEASARLRR